MAKQSYSPAKLTHRLAAHAASNTSFFAHQAGLQQQGLGLVVHPTLDPSRKNGSKIIIRESRDSEKYPQSRAIGIIFDGTGSMRKNPADFVQRLPKILPLLIASGWVKYPHILFGVVGDAKGDKVPLQIGQFEGDNAMDNVLANAVLEGNGQSNMRESYELAAYFINNYADIDCFNKRRQKGYLFFIGDERPFAQVSREEALRLIGEDTPTGKDIPTQDIWKELDRRFNVYWITPSGTRYWDNDEICDEVRETFGQRYIRLENPALIAETIVGLIATNEGAERGDISKALTDISGADAAKVVSKAIANASTTTKTSVLKIGGKLPTPKTFTPLSLTSGQK